MRLLQQRGADSPLTRGNFRDLDVLSDPEIRQGIKEFSSWPTIPQIYVKGEFMGGSDILIEMYNSGELKEKLEVALAS